MPSDTEQIQSPIISSIVNDLSNAIRNLKLLDQELNGSESARLVRQQPMTHEPASGQLVKLDVSGMRFHSTLETLKSVSGSKLANLCYNPPLNEQGAFALDRDPTIFKHVLKYLQSDRKFFPPQITPNEKSLIEQESKYW